MTNKTKEKNYFANVNILDLPIDSVSIADYQRNLDKARVVSIASTFDIDRMRPIEVTYRDGHYYCFDGQHRLAAYQTMKMPTIPAIVHYDCNYQREAALFAKQADNVAKVSNRARWNASRLAGEKQAETICKICNTFGYEVAAKKTDPLINIQCIATLNKVFDEQGEAGLSWVMKFIYNCWYGLPHAVSCDIVDGLGAIRKQFGKNLDEKKLYEVLHKTTPEVVIRDASKYRIGAYTRRENRGVPIAKTIVGMYNRGYRTNSPKRLPDPFAI